MKSQIFFLASAYGYPYDEEGQNATTAEDFERCFVYNRIPKPKFMRVKVGAYDFYECRVIINLLLL